MTSRYQLLVLLVCYVVLSVSCSSTVDPTEEEVASNSLLVTSQPQMDEDGTDELSFAHPATQPPEPKPGEEETVPEPLNEAGDEERTEEQEVTPEPLDQAADDEVEPTVPPVAVSPASFSLSTANQTVPQDVVEEAYFVGGGGAGRCTGAVTICIWPDRDKTMRLNDIAVLFVPGWDSGDSTVQLYSPDGKVRTVQGITYDSEFCSESPCFYLDVPIGLQERAGQYTFVFTNKGQRVERSFQVEAPTGPITYIYMDEDKVPLRVDLFNFRPHEGVRLLAYNERRRFVGWSHYETDATGFRTINVPYDTSLLYAAVGDQSGEAGGVWVHPHYGITSFGNAPISRPGVRQYQTSWAGGSLEYVVDLNGAITEPSFISCEGIEEVASDLTNGRGLYLFDKWDDPVPNPASYWVLANWGEGWAVQEDDMFELCPHLASLFTVEEESVDCINDSTFVRDVTIPDDTWIAAGDSFVKTWLLRNTGTCTWTEGYRFVHVLNEQMGAASSVELPHVVAPGETVEISVRFTAPRASGKHLSTWQLQTSEGERFGREPYVRIVVP